MKAKKIPACFRPYPTRLGRPAAVLACWPRRFAVPDPGRHLMVECVNNLRRIGQFTVWLRGPLSVDAGARGGVAGLTYKPRLLQRDLQRVADARLPRLPDGLRQGRVNRFDLPSDIPATRM
jgi:hypothetical protein